MFLLDQRNIENGVKIDCTLKVLIHCFHLWNLEEIA